ncbi:hypothetical protein M9H77_28039 [Catharanthus roseus]|uniref:Uncharacterized protein n=1 Tax=Catharanthus roseus TaxID=4058 RepID=A0ACC0AEU8_CATRO|nr:hypothetical protein M9H77_28039 [Catharanthus roseus]
MKQTLSTRYGVENHEGQGPSQAKVKLTESFMDEENLKLHTMKEKRRVEYENFNEEQNIIESTSTPLEECEYKKSVLTIKSGLLVPLTICLIVFLQVFRNLMLKKYKMKEVLATSSTKP